MPIVPGLVNKLGDRGNVVRGHDIKHGELPSGT
jgi:hypothetical protein